VHFNAMLMQTRAIGVSIVIAVFGAAAVSVAQYPERKIVLLGAAFHVAALESWPGGPISLNLTCSISAGQGFGGAVRVLWHPARRGPSRFCCISRRLDRFDVPFRRVNP
jgi:hypothetical protein